MWLLFHVLDIGDLILQIILYFVQNNLKRRTLDISVCPLLHATASASVILVFGSVESFGKNHVLAYKMYYLYILFLSCLLWCNKLVDAYLFINHQLCSLILNPNLTSIQTQTLSLTLTFTKS